MKAIKFAEPWKVACVDQPMPEPKEGEALIKIHCAAVCGSDIGAFRGTNGLVSYPRVIGHELAGVVVSIPENNKNGIKVGDRLSVAADGTLSADKQTDNNLTATLKANYDAAYQHSQASHAPADAEKNVQSDWNVTDSASDAFIKNKPAIPSQASDVGAIPTSQKGAARRICVFFSRNFPVVPIWVSPSTKLPTL